MNQLGIKVLAAFSVLGLGIAGGPVRAQTAATPNPAAFVTKWDRSGKGLLDIKAVFNAAIVKFEMLDKDHKGRLTKQDLTSVMSAQDFATANPDGDVTIGAQEWFDLVRRSFDMANPDNDGSISVEELKTPAGQALLKLVQ